MPENDEYTTFTDNTNTGTSGWSMSAKDLDDILHDIDRSTERAKKKMKKRKENKEKTLVFNCDWCGNKFRETIEKVDAEKNRGYFCSLKCKIEGKYGRSSLSKELFELDEEKEEDNGNNN